MAFNISKISDFVTGIQKKVSNESFESKKEIVKVGKSEFADLIYTINWVLLGMREFSLAENGKYRPQLDKIIDLLVSIQDDSESLSFKGCWRGMYDVKNHTWNCGDMYEGGSGSIYTGWTNAPISLGLLFECIGKSFLGA